MSDIIINAHECGYRFEGLAAEGPVVLHNGQEITIDFDGSAITTTAAELVDLFGVLFDWKAKEAEAADEARKGPWVNMEIVPGKTIKAPKGFMDPVETVTEVA